MIRNARAALVRWAGTWPCIAIGIEREDEMAAAMISWPERRDHLRREPGSQRKQAADARQHEHEAHHLGARQVGEVDRVREDMVCPLGPTIDGMLVYSPWV